MKSSPRQLKSLNEGPSARNCEHIFLVAPCFAVKILEAVTPVTMSMAWRAVTTTCRHNIGQKFAWPAGENNLIRLARCNLNAGGTSKPLPALRRTITTPFLRSAAIKASPSVAYAPFSGNMQQQHPRICFANDRSFIRQGKCNEIDD